MEMKFPPPPFFSFVSASLSVCVPYRDNLVILRMTSPAAPTPRIKCVLARRLLPFTENCTFLRGRFFPTSARMTRDKWLHRKAGKTVDAGSKCSLILRACVCVSLPSLLAASSVRNSMSSPVITRGGLSTPSHPQKNGQFFATIFTPSALLTASNYRHRRPNWAFFSLGLPADAL